MIINPINIFGKFKVDKLDLCDIMNINKNNLPLNSFIL